MTTPLLAAEDLRVRFDLSGGFLGMLRPRSEQRIEAVAGVSFTIGEGETLGVVGESGSGKSTLARAIMGLIPIAEGSVRFRGQELSGLGPRDFMPIRRQVSMMFQDPVGSLSPRQTVGNLIGEPFRIHGLAGRSFRQEIQRLLELVGLPTYFADRYPYQLSGGQARRVGVARALALDPKLIIADEPTAGLDVSVQGEILNLFRELQQRLGLSFLFITHNLNVVRHVSDRMAIMYLGRMVETGDTDRIFEAPRHPYTLSLLSANPEPDPDAQMDRIELKGEIPSLLTRPRGCEFHTRCPFVQTDCETIVPTEQHEGDGRTIRCLHPLSSGRH